MSLFAGSSREELRGFYVDAWRKHRGRLPLSPMEALICDVIALHPEYHATLEDADKAEGYEAPAAEAARNPFLHMGLHLAVREQVSVDRPPGIRRLSQQLAAQYGAHQWEHALMQALGDILWDSQRSGLAPDESRYLATARELLNVK
jgi:hypothetical protein